MGAKPEIPISTFSLCGGEGINFDGIAHLYGETRRLPSSLMEPTVEALSRELGEYDTVLEVGVGIGRWAILLQQRGINLLGVDTSSRMLARGWKEGLRGVLQADALHLPFGDKTVDAAFSVHTLPFIEDWKGALKEIARVTRTAYYTIATHSVEGESPSGPYWKSIRGAGGQVFSLIDQRRGALWGSVTAARNAYYEVANFWSEHRSPGGLYWRVVQKAGYLDGPLGIHERELPDVIDPSKRVLIGNFVTHRRSADVVKAFGKKVYSAQWRVPDEIHRRAMEAIAHGSFDETTSVKKRVELLRWDVGDLSLGPPIELDVWSARRGDEASGAD